MAVGTTIDVVMPQMGESVTEGTILEWHKQEGDEISTDKVDAEVPAPSPGRIVRIHAREGDTVAVGAVLAELQTNGAVPTTAREGVSDEGDPVPGTELAEEAAAEEAEQVERTEAPSSSPGNGGDPAATAPPAAAPSPETVDIVMPQMGESVTEGTILEWHKQEGDEVAADETIVEISTDKVDAEVPAPVGGTLAEVLVGPGDTVQVGQVIARLAPSGAEVASAPEPDGDAAAPSAAQPAQTVDGEPSTGARASPVARRVAAALGVDLDAVEGSGPRGRISKADVLAAADGGRAAPAAPEHEPA